MIEPDLYIGGKADPYMLRYYIIPRNKYLNIYLHKMVKDDDDRALHDHPWPFLTIILWGGYTEVQPAKEYIFDWYLAREGIRTGLWKSVVGRLTEYVRKPFSIHYRPEFWPHRLRLRGKCSWSIIITGRQNRNWGFYTRSGWVRWEDFTINTGKESVYADQKAVRHHSV